MVFQFSDYVLDDERRTLHRHGVSVVLTPKVFQTLLALVRHHDRVLSKDELCDLIWPDQIVEESNLTQNISVLRRTLDQATSGRKHIATFHGHGYRFVEPVLSSPCSPPQPSQSPRPSTVSEPPSAARHQSRLVWALGAAVFLIAVTIWSAKLLMHHPVAASVIPPPLTVSLETATRLPGAQFEPAWSPDGSAFVFANRDANVHKSGLYLQRSGEMQPRLIVEGLYNSPVFSPDGRTLAAVHVLKDAQELVLVDLEHSTARTLTRLFPHRYGLEYRHLDWSPDGSLLAVDDKVTETDPLSLYLVHIRSGDKYRLTFPTFDIIGDVSPRFSPDGSELAFIRIRYQGQNTVMHVPVTGGEASLLFDPSSLISDVDWLSNDRVLYVARLDDRFRFWTQSTLSPTQKPRLALSAAMDTPVQFAVQRRLDRLALSAFSSNLNIWSMTMDRTHTWQPIITTPGQDVSPTYSPNGTRIAFRSDLGGHERIWISSVDGTNAHALDTGEAIPAVHAWDADSQTILFKSRNGSGLLSIRSSPGATVQRVSELSVSHPASSIDGKSIFARTGHFVFRIHRDTGHVDKLTTGGGAPLVPSQDGRYLYFADGRMGSRIERLDLQTEQQRTILKTLLPGYNESWALTSSGIYFLTERAGVPIITFHDLATEKDRFVSEFPGDMPPVGDSGFTASPRGDRLMVVRGEPIACNIQITSVSGLKDH